MPATVESVTNLKSLARRYRAACDYEWQTYRLVDEAAARGECYEDAEYPGSDAARRLVLALRAAGLRYVVVDGHMFIDASFDTTDLKYVYEDGCRFVILTVSTDPKEHREGVLACPSRESRPNATNGRSTSKRSGRET